MRQLLSPCTSPIYLLAVACLPVSAQDAAVLEKTVSYDRDIRPLLSDRCFQCHGPHEEARQADLRLDSADAQEGPFRDRGGYQVIQPKEVEASGIWQRLTTADESERMPPADSHKPPLTDEEQALIKQWILEGADYEDFWAFVPPEPRTAPDVKDHGWLSQRLDSFVRARLERANIKPQPKADKRTLIRRLTFDLTGLPPTPAEIHDFIDDPSPAAYAKLVDRLLASPRYGEHMAKYWLDLVRFADTNGIHHDHYREMTPYRDWVIRAFNGNLRFDDFITFQLAGDLYEQPTIDQQIASGFNRLHLVIDRGTALPEESYTRNVVDRVSGFGTAFMGLTLGCAVCHDHKYDPVTQTDFYQLFAFFNNIDTEPETPGKNTHAPFIRLPSAEQRARFIAIDARMSVLVTEIDELTDALSNLKDDPAQEVAAKEVATKQKRAVEERKALDKEKADLESNMPVTLVSKERAEIRPAYVLTRGAYDQPGEEVKRDTPAFLPPLPPTPGVKTRMDLARWLTDEQHPLTARVAVNRFWQHCFGVGLVKTSEDFGAQGEYPSHPELLDDLASSFARSQWDVKGLVKSFVLSETYQQSSRAPADAFRADPENRLLARGSRFRLDSETIRDQILFVSGSLSESMYGKSVKPPQPPNLWKSVSMVSSSTYAFQADSGEKIYRRSLYSFWKRAMPPPQMTIFDAPTRESCVARRERTNTPVQALVLMNEGQYFQAAKNFARRLAAKRDASDEERLSFAYESITSHPPDAAELTSLTRGLAAIRAIYREDPEMAKAMTADLDATSDETSHEDRVELAAYAMLVNTLFNLDVTKTRE